MASIDEPSPFIGSEEKAVGNAASSRTVLIEGARPMRSDAVKNRERILQAAEEIFSVEGVAVPIDAVAAKAGVGVGTLYRHFPNKEALFEAIVIDHISQLLDTADALKVADDPGAALFVFLRELSKHASAKRDLFHALTSAGIDFKSRCSELVDEMTRNVDELLNRAVAAGGVRDDLSAEEIINLVIGACHAGAESGVDEVRLQRMVGVVIDGLRPVSASRPAP